MRFPSLNSTGLALLVPFLALAAAATGCSDPAQPTPPTTTEPAFPPAAPPPTTSTPSPPPITGGTLLVLRDGLAAVASDADRDTISIVDLGARTLRAQITLDPGSEPGRSVEDAAGRVHVALRGAGAVVTLDVNKGRVLMRRSLCQAPRGLAFESTTGLLHLACAGGELISIGAMDSAPARTVHLDRDLRDVMVRGKDLLVTTFRKAELLVVAPNGTTTRLGPERTPAVFFSQKGLPRAEGFPGQAPAAAPGMAMAEPGVAWRMVEGPTGDAMVIHQRAVEDEIGTQPSAYASGPECAGIVETTVSTMTATGEMAVRSGRALASTVVAVDMAVSPDGHQIAVVSAGSAGTDRQLQFFDTVDVSQPTKPMDPNPCVGGTTTPKPGNGLDLPPPPMGGMVPPKPVDYLAPNGEVVAVAYDRAGNVIVQSRQPATVQILTQRAAPIVLSNEVRADVGHQMFHTATSGKVACASCHPEGSEDGRVWRFFGEGKRRTQSLRGGIMDTAPFHWNGTLPTLAHLMRDVFQGRMAGRPVDRTDMDTLSRWVDKIRSVPTSTWHDSAAVARGQALFQDTTVACGSCHSGPDLTNGKSVDVGTGGLFQVPQLHNLAFRAPFMHDGCAATLADRFSQACGGGDKHGVTSQLSRTQIADLVAYLETL